jgi:hypothetical protein
MVVCEERLSSALQVLQNRTRTKWQSSTEGKLTLRIEWLHLIESSLLLEVLKYTVSGKRHSNGIVEGMHNKPVTLKDFYQPSQSSGIQFLL